MAETLIAGRYRLDTLLGRGGMSEVWGATDLELERHVALKLLAPNEDTERFEREARAFAALAHPNVTQLYDYGESDGRPFMVLEYLPGGSLEELLRKNGVLADEETRRIASDLANGLSHAHARGVVHRDLKPSNVLFDDESRAKLADFGIARMTAGEGTLTEAGTVLGTAAYISPEQATGLPATPASDVYSFGVLLFRMLTGRLPFESDDPLTLVLQHRDEPPPPVAALRPDAPADLAALTEASLQKNPAVRPADGGALLQALTTGAGDTVATRVLPAAPAPRPRRRFGAVLAAAVLMLLALAGGVLAYEVTRSPESPAQAPPPALPATSTARHRATTTAPTTTTTPATAPSPTTTTSAPVTTQRITPTARPATTAQAPTTTAPPPPPPTTTVDTTTAFTTTTVPTTTDATTTGP